MLLVDDILLFPVHGLKFIFREIANSINQEIANEAQTIRRELTELYMRLETGKITEAEFDAKEGELLDRLDAAESRDAGDQADTESA